MRWENQTLDIEASEALPGLQRIPGLVRSVTTPEFAGVTFHEVTARSVLNKVPASSDVPFRWTVNPYRGCTHACSYCLSGDTPVLMADGRVKPLDQVRVGDRVYGTRRVGTYRRYVSTEVLAHWRTVKPAYRVELEDGTLLIASGDHRFLTNRGWKHVSGTGSGAGQRPHLTTRNEMLGVGQLWLLPKICDDYRRGYLTGMIRGDGHLGEYRYQRPGRVCDVQYRFRLALADREALDRTREYLATLGVATYEFAFAQSSKNRREIMAIRASSKAAVTAVRELVRWPSLESEQWRCGFLAGIFDAEGSFSGSLRILNCDREIIDHIESALDSFGFRYVIEDYRQANGLRTVRLLGGLRECMRFFHTVDPAITRKLTIDGAAIKSDAKLRVVSVSSLGLDIPMYDITTGAGDFIANGVVSHNCFARGSHEWLEFDSGHDFDSQIVVKINAPDVLAREVARRSWSHEHVALGTNTDPYQRAEGRYRLMPGIIGALAGSGTPFSILTKGPLLRRDLPLLVEASSAVEVGLAVSIAILDEQLHQSVEPGTPSPRARLGLVQAIREAGFDCHVLLAPVLPWLTDSTEQLDEIAGRLATAGASRATMIPLHLRPGTRQWFMQWLQREHPDLVPRYQQLYGRGAYVPATYNDELKARIGPILERHGLDRRSGDASHGHRGSRMVRPAPDASTDPAEQLRLI